MSAPSHAASPADDDDEKHLQTFLQEIRIVVPGAQIVGAFLFSVPFQSRFETLSPQQKNLFVVIFVATMSALVLFMAPAIYHRVASPIHAKKKFVAMATGLLLAGFVPLSISTALSVYLVVAVALGDGAAAWIAGAFAALVVGVWGVLPLARLHDRSGGAPSP